MPKEMKIQLQFNPNPSKLNISKPKLVSTNNDFLMNKVTKIDNAMIEKHNCDSKRSTKSNLSISKPILTSTSNSSLGKKVKVITNLTYPYNSRGVKLDLTASELSWLTSIYECERNKKF